MMQSYSLDNKLKTTREELLSIATILQKEKRTTIEEKTISYHKDNYSENAHSTPQYTQDYYGLEISAISLGRSILESPTARVVDTTWDPEQYDKVHSPVQIGRVNEKFSFQKLGQPRCSHLPIKMAGDNEYRIPTEYSGFKDVLTQIVSTETALNPSIIQYYAYLTVDQRFVPKGNSQRIKGAHVDGIPRNRDNPRSQRIDHSYIVCDCLPTKFFLHEFPQMKLCDLNKHNFFMIFDRFKDDSRSLIIDPFNIYLMNAYSVHSAINSERDVIRTFLRLEFSTLKFDREGNSKNPYFSYAWESRSCHTPKHLVFPEFLV